MATYSGISAFASHRILDFVLGRNSFIVPANYLIALSTTPLGENGTNLTEPTDPVYTRILLPNDLTSFSSPIGRIVDIIREYLHAPSSQDWGSVTHFCLVDSGAIGAGNVWFYGELQEPIWVEIESSPWLRAGDNSLMLDICGGSSGAMSISTVAANQILSHMFSRNPVLVPPENWYMGVSSTPMNSEGIGFSEPTGGGYARVQIENSKTSFTNASNKTVSLATEFRFPTSTTPWGFYIKAPYSSNVIRQTT